MTEGLVMQLKEVGDRLEIHDVLARYCHAIDQRKWTDLRAVFSEDAKIDFAALDGPVGSADDLIAFLQPIVESMSETHHTVSTIMCDVEGEVAQCRSAAHVTMSAVSQLGQRNHSQIGLWYKDVLVRTASGWRIALRVQERGWVISAPAQ